LEQLEVLDRLLQLMLLLLRDLLLRRAAVSPVAAIESLEQLELLDWLLHLMLLLRDLLLLIHDALKQADSSQVRLCLLEVRLCRLEVRSALFSVPLSEVRESLQQETVVLRHIGLRGSRARREEGYP
jgi:hypothetical protein